MENMRIKKNRKLMKINHLHKIECYTPWKIVGGGMERKVILNTQDSYPRMFRRESISLI